jgi:hypothetical protein
MSDVHQRDLAKATKAELLALLAAVPRYYYLRDFEKWVTEELRQIRVDALMRRMHDLVDELENVSARDEWDRYWRLQNEFTTVCEKLDKLQGTGKWRQQHDAH